MFMFPIPHLRDSHRLLFAILYRIIILKSLFQGDLFIDSPPAALEQQGGLQSKQITLK